ncbi:MAG TPA: SDR family NAD(P)-dependent oxidoreductase, partial [Longimicrobiaceae bacterium]|nr:SDR family NAD(P)-dependent oxidoreductase [Longimicrobiaceae bacterium]
LGFRFEVGKRFTAADIATRLSIAEQHQRLLRRLLVILEEEGMLQGVRDGWMVARVPGEQDPAAQWEALRRRYPTFATELTLVARCAAGLADVLRGAADPLQLLFPGGSLGDAEKLYQETPVARTYNALVREAVAAALRDHPADRPLRILEIGAGTGGTTSCVLPGLPGDRTEYVFTDISRRFIGQAKQKFKEYPFVRYALLDITRDPEAQGFAPHQFDLVIAANVVHATPDLRRTLAHVQRLLAAEGLLVLYEATRPQRFSDLTVGLTPGWWSFTDHELRPDCALLSHRRWRKLLTDLGFSRATSLPDENAAGVLAHQALVLARSPAAVRPAAADPRPWLIVADAQGTGARLAAALRERGDAALVVTAGSSYRRVAEESIEIDPTSRDDFDRLLTEAPAGWRKVVYLWALDAALQEEMDTAELIGRQQQVIGGALHLVQALATAAGEAAPLWLVTRGAQPAGRDPAPVSAAQSSLWGLGHTIALEHPELRCVRIDLDRGCSGDEEAGALLSQLLRDGVGEDQIALCGGIRRVRRLIRAPAFDPPAAELRFAEDASYLITGGMRGLGLRVAEWMVERGARHLILVGRRDPSPSAQDAIHRMEGAGARIHVAQGDVSCRQRLGEIIVEMEATLPPLTGVIHSAGVLDDGVLQQQSWPRFAAVMAPKVAGSWNLHSLTRHLPLDFFVLFSSGVALLGAGGQGNHAAANAFLDALAYYRRAQGLPALTLNWGAWSDVGAAADHRLEERGAATFTPRQGLQALEWALQSPSRPQSQNGTHSRVQLAVLAVDWREFFASSRPGTEPPVLREIAKEVRAGGESQPTSVQAPPLLQQLAAAPPNRRRLLLQTHVRSLAAQVLGVGEAQRIALDQPLQELGLDSLMAVELRNKLALAVERPLSATLLFEHPTVAAIASFLDTDLLSGPSQPASRTERVPGAREPHEIALDEDDLAALLLKKLEHIEAGK